MKRSLFLFCLVFCAAICAVVLLANRSEASAKVGAGFQGFTKGFPNWIVDSWFIRMSPQRAQLMKAWFDSGTNAAQFSVTNATKHAIRISPMARFETPDQQRETPVLTARNFRGVYIGSGEVKTIQVASLPHGDKWRVSFSYARDDGGGHAFLNAWREVHALLTGAPNPLRTQDDFRDSIVFFSNWTAK
jgi:copper oxidase (laccase) domain-containing protein